MCIRDSRGHEADTVFQEGVYRAEPPMAERAVKACAAWGNGSPLSGFSASQTARRALLHDGGYRTGDRVSNKKCSILFEWNIFYCNFKGILSQKREKRITAPSPKNPPACGSILSAAERCV